MIVPLGGGPLTDDPSDERHHHHTERRSGMPDRRHAWRGGRRTGDYAGRPVILLVDDHADSREFVAAVLSGAGLAIAEAATAREALERTSMAPRPALVLLDLALPDISGIELIGALRAMPACAALPIVILSASVTPADRAAVAAAGCDAFLAKPVLPDHLLAVVMRVLGPAGR